MNEFVMLYLRRVISYVYYLFVRLLLLITYAGRAKHRVLLRRIYFVLKYFIHTIHRSKVVAKAFSVLFQILNQVSSARKKSKCLKRKSRAIISCDVLSPDFCGLQKSRSRQRKADILENYSADTTVKQISYRIRCIKPIRKP